MKLGPEWHDLIEEAQACGFDGLEGRFWPRKVILTRGLKRYKVRCYPTQQWARELDEVIRIVQGKIKLPTYLGRESEFLVFEHIQVDEPEQVDPSLTCEAIGKQLGTLATIASVNLSASYIDKEFTRWLEELSQIGFISSHASELINQAYFSLKPSAAQLCVDYWDAMPHNFGWSDGEFFLLDEKHLRFSFMGVGLVKPCLLLTAEEFTTLLEGYSTEHGVGFFHEHYPFLLMYYLVAALHYYSLQLRDGDRWITANSRLRYYRAGLIRSIWPSPSRRFVEALRFFLIFPLASLMALRNRLAEPISWSKVRARLKTEFSPWDRDAF